MTEPVKLKRVKKVKRILVLGIVVSLLLAVVLTGACITQAGEPTSTEELKAIAPVILMTSGASVDSLKSWRMKHEQYKKTGNY